MKYSIRNGKVISTGKWPTTKSEALRESILKYKWLFAWHKAHPKAKAQKVDSESCALCHLYYFETDSHFDNCEGCPVKKYTGLSECQRTPWADYESEIDPLLARSYAQAEATFLEGLR